jgi:hypothetical protein
MNTPSDGNGVQRDVGWLAATLAALSGLFVFLGYKTTGFSWLATNEPVLFALAVGLFVVAGGLLGWTLRIDASDPNRPRWVKAAFFIMIAGAIVAVITGVRGWRSHSELSVESASFRNTGAGALALDATVGGQRLSSDTRLVAFADELVWNSDNKGFDVTHLRSDSFAPDAKGEVSRALHVELPPGTYEFVGIVSWIGGKREFDAGTDCYNRGSTDRHISCLVLRVPRAAEKPQLALGWIKRAKKPPDLKIRFTARYTNDSPTALSVAGVAKGGARRLIAAYSFAPDVNGHFDKTLSVEIAKKFISVCVIATISPASTMCPRQPQRRAVGKTVWAWLGVPRT